MRLYEASHTGHDAIEGGTVCDRMSPTDRPCRYKGSGRMRSYEASQAGHGAVDEGTICDRMSPHRLAASP